MIPNLHYENMRDSPEDPKQLMYDCFKGFGDIYRYLRYSMVWLMDQTLSINCSMYEEAPIRTSAPSITRQRPEESKTCWVRLEEDEHEETQNNLEEFLDEGVTRIYDSKANGHSPIRVLDCDSERGLLKLSRRPRGNTLYLRPSTYTLDKQMDSLLSLQNRPLERLLPLVKLGIPSYRFNWPIVSTSLAAEKKEVIWAGDGVTEPELLNVVTPARWYFLSDGQKEGTGEQRKFVTTALNTPDFAILEGPPGSGKTTAICEYILQEIALGHRVLLCASTHVAVDNVLENLDVKGYTGKSVIAVRIGNEKSISEVTNKFGFGKRVETERKQLLKSLSTIKNPQMSQKFLVESLQDEGNDTIQRLILDCSNLVCGTTIGILMHPDIRTGKVSKSRPFDTLIIDESSKTTFPEFLVPALYAKKWILVGDVNQLSPYVDEGYVQANLRGMLPAEDAKVCLSASSAKKTPHIVEFATREDREHYSMQAKLNSLSCVVLEGGPHSKMSPPALEVFAADTIVASPETLIQWADLLPSSLENRTMRRLEVHRRRHEYHKHKTSTPDVRPEPSWEYAASWRLMRSFELRNVQENRLHYDEELKQLIPAWYDFRETEEMKRNFELVKRIGFTSVIEMLQRGSSHSAMDAHTALSQGIPSTALGARTVRLSYQHRMHPDISKFPRDEFYESEALRDISDMRSRRKWSFSRYSHRTVWVDIRSQGREKTRNLEEVSQTIRELKAFTEWSRRNKQSDGTGETGGHWSVAILTFYRAQERALRKTLRQLFQSQNIRSFVDDNLHVKVTLSTVDKYQGREADLVILSFVRNRRSGVGFLDCPNRLNVALTRARYQLVMIGDYSFFSRQSRSELLGRLAKATHHDIYFGAG